MTSSNQGVRRVELRSSYVAWALGALVILIAAGSSLQSVGAPGTVTPAAMVPAYADAPASFSKAADAFGAGGGALGSPATELVGDDEMRVAEDVDSAARVDTALIVRTAVLELEVADVAAILVDARHAIADLGGYVSGSDEVDQGEHRWASATYRVPVARFDEAIDVLRDLSSRVARETTASTEVTATVVDLDARIANLRASEAALVDIMERAGRIEDVLAVQMRLEDVRGQIERLEGQRASLADQAALSTLTVTWFTPIAAVDVAQQGWDAATEVDTALAQTVGLQSLASLTIWMLLVALPLLGLPALAIALLLVLLRRGRRGAPPVPSAP
jgi:hypothetical protein